jgi:hypothetical protein
MKKSKLMDSLRKFFAAKKITLKDEDLKELEGQVGDDVVEKLDEVLSTIIPDADMRQKAIQAILPVYEQGEAHGETMAAEAGQKPVEKPEGEDGDGSADLKGKLDALQAAFDALKEAMLAKSEVETAAETGNLGVLDSAKEYYKAGLAKFGVDPKEMGDSLTDLRASFRAASKYKKTGIKDSAAVGDIELDDSCKKIKI